MKKLFSRLLPLLLALTLILTMIPAVSAAGVDKMEAYKAYYDYLKAEIYGLGEAVRDEDYYKMFTDKIKRPAITEKLLGVWFVDVTNDGIEELIIKRFVTHDSGAMIDFSDAEWICVYSYIDGQIKRIGQNASWARCAGTDKYGSTSWSYYEPVGFIGEILSSWEYPYISDDVLRVCTGKDGKVYLCDDKIVHGIEGTFSFYSFNGTHMAETAEFEVNWVADWYYGGVHSNYGTNLYYVNDEKVSYNTYMSRLDNYTSGGTYELRNNDYMTVFNTLADAMEGYYIPSSWAVGEVEEAKHLGYVPANLQENYTKPITRAEFCALAVNLYESEKGVIADRMEFDDTDDVNVQKMGALGVVNGVGNNLFAPDAQLTRQQAATMLARLANAMGSPLPEGSVEFADAGEIASWAYTQVGQVFAAGVMNGVGNNTFAPAKSYTREQAILTVLRLSKAL